MSEKSGADYRNPEVGGANFKESGLFYNPSAVLADELINDINLGAVPLLSVCEKLDGVDYDRVIDALLISNNNMLIESMDNQFMFHRNKKTNH